MPASRHSTGLLLGQIFGTLVWGAFFVLTPWEVLFIGSIVWLPLLIYYGRVQARRNVAWSGLLVQAGIVIAIIIAAAKAPTKYEDHRVGPLRNTVVSLGELAAANIIYRN
jgi:hypothetical protein